MILTILIFIIVLGLLVFVHELGHFVMAKRAGMTVEEFGFGFPPRIFGIKKGDTIYSINWIPLGGFVKILGEDGTDALKEGSFGSKSAVRRFLVLIAGVAMNFVFAWLLISLGMGLGLPTVVGQGEQLPSSAKLRDVSVAIVEVASNSPADQAGVRIGDRIVEINGQPVSSIENLQELTAQNAGINTSYVISRGENKVVAQITPRESPPENEGPLGIALASVGYVAYPWYSVLYHGLIATYNLTYATISAFAEVIGNLIGGMPAGVDITGPVGIAKLTGDVAELGFIYLLQFTAVLSINLGIINAVPFPALDGGRILFLVIEKLRRKKLPEAAESWANTIGFVLLLTLMFFVTVKDVGRFELLKRIKDIF